MHEPENSLAVAPVPGPEPPPAAGTSSAEVVAEGAASPRPVSRRIVVLAAVAVLLPLGWGLGRDAGDGARRAGESGPRGLARRVRTFFGPLPEASTVRELAQQHPDASA